MVADPSAAVFVAYSRDDKDVAFRLAGDLKAAGASVWIDESDIPPGARWGITVQDAVRRCSCLLVILTPASVESNEVENEYSFALDNHRKVVPILYRDCEVPLRLRVLHHIDFRIDYATGLELLLKSLGMQQSTHRASPLVSASPPQSQIHTVEVADQAAQEDRMQSPEGVPSGRLSWITESVSDWFKKEYKDRSESQDEDKRERSNLIRANPKVLDLHLSYSQGFELGPIIQRTGDGPPIMDDPEKPGSYTADPERQRIGTNYVIDTMHQEHSEDLFLLFAANYVLFAALPNRQTDPALEGAHDAQPWEFVIRKIKEFNNELECSAVKRALGPANFHVANLVMVSSLVPEFQQFLNGNPKWFRKPNLPFFPTYGDEYEAIQTRCARLIDTLYKKADYSDFVEKYAVHKNEEAFRIKVKSGVEKYLELFLLSRSAWSHQEQARKKLQRTGASNGQENQQESEIAHGLAPTHEDEIVFMQGCGDLTMNLWNVAFVSDKSCYRTEGWDLLHSPDEPLNDREYTCLIKWNCKRDDIDLRKVAQTQRVVYPYQISRLRFMAPWLDRRESPKRHVFLGDLPIGHLIEFAVYGKQIYSGDIVDKSQQLDDCLQERLRAVVPQFSDVRHIYRLPNLNPPINFPEGETASAGLNDYRKQPRYLFNERTLDDMWLCERGLIHGDRNLRVAALNQAIHIDKRELGAPENWIKFVLRKEVDRYGNDAYVENEAGSELKKGQWRWIKEGRENWLEIFFRSNHYPCSMIAVTAEDEGKGRSRDEKGTVVDTKEIFFCVHGHNYGRYGCTVPEAAKFLAESGAYNILVFDEGEDVFQLVQKKGGGLKQTVPLKRAQIRCVFWGTTKSNAPRGE
ncbi:MAG TPA: toll/interleukin-1 receptor domain-containing protein [Terriglobales bacterium]